MGLLDDKLGGLNGGRILDVATSQGGFVKDLVEAFDGFEEAIGIDIDPERLKQAEEEVQIENVRFGKMDGAHLEFADNSFDTVAMRHSIHHVDHPETVLSEMMRVLKPGGLIIINEVIQDEENVQANSQRHIHHWWGEVDRIKGVPHNETLTANEVRALTDGLPLNDQETVECFEPPTKEEGAKFIEEMVGAVDKYIERLGDKPEYQDLIERGLKIKETILNTGCSWEKEVLVMGRKK